MYKALLDKVSRGRNLPPKWAAFFIAGEKPGEMEAICSSFLPLLILCRPLLWLWALAWACGALSISWRGTAAIIPAPKLIYRGECLKSAAIQVGKQALFSLSLLAISIAAQGMWGGPAGIIVSIGTGIVIVSYTIADAVHQRTFAEECHIKTIEEYGRLALRHLNELQFA